MKDLPVKFSNLEKRCPEALMAKRRGAEFRWSLYYHPHYKLFVVKRDGKKHFVSCGKHKLYVKEKPHGN